MIEAIISGIGAGILFSFITGPVFFAMLKTSIEKGFKAGFSLAIGVVFSDIIFIALTIFGTQFIGFEAQIHKYIGFVGGIFLLGVGLYYLIKKVKVCYTIEEDVKIRKRGYILKGFLMCLLTPTTLMFWLMVGGIVTTQLQYNMQQKLVFFFCAMTTQLCVDSLKTYYASKLRYRIKEKTIQRLNQIAGLVILIFALRLIYQVLITHWPF